VVCLQYTRLLAVDWNESGRNTPRGGR